MTPRRHVKASADEQRLVPEVDLADERERATFNEGGTYGMFIGMYLGYLTALVFALFGHLLVPFVLLALGVMPAMVTLTYAEKRGVDAFAILARGGSRASTLSGMATLTILLLISGAMMITTFTGSGLLEFEISQRWSDRLSSAGSGAAIGTGIGAALGYLAALWVVMRRRKQQNEPDDDEE